MASVSVDEFFLFFEDLLDELFVLVDQLFSIVSEFLLQLFIGRHHLVHFRQLNHVLCPILLRRLLLHQLLLRLLVHCVSLGNAGSLTALSRPPLLLVGILVEVQLLLQGCRGLSPKLVTLGPILHTLVSQVLVRRSERCLLLALPHLRGICRSLRPFLLELRNLCRSLVLHTVHLVKLAKACVTFGSGRLVLIGLVHVLHLKHHPIHPVHIIIHVVHLLHLLHLLHLIHVVHIVHVVHVVHIIHVVNVVHLLHLLHLIHVIHLVSLVRLVIVIHLWLCLRLLWLLLRLGRSSSYLSWHLECWRSSWWGSLIFRFSRSLIHCHLLNIISIPGQSQLLLLPILFAYLLHGPSLSLLQLLHPIRVP
mmetsp:Transcript_17021/g.12185  ORF Transcript_17021/g.12185 Transcript_17021/m.12185 type:complete len:363 (-) Transcript_17021:340-1428(-)